MRDAPVCVECGATGGTALGWATERAPDGRERLVCPECTRRHVRDIEAKLPPEWWAR